MVVALAVRAVVVTVGVAFKVVGGLENGIKNGRPNLITLSAGIALFIAHAFLIWFTFLGGAVTLE